MVHAAIPMSTYCIVIFIPNQIRWLCWSGHVVCDSTSPDDEK